MDTRQQKAFEKYLAMGPSRSLPKLAEETGIPVPTLKYWSRKFRWSKLIEEREKPIVEQMAKDNDEALKMDLETTQRLRSALHILANQFIEQLESGAIKPRNVADFERLVKVQSMMVQLSKIDEDYEDNVNLVSLVTVLKRSGWDEIEDPDKEVAEDGN
ncbi:hypothetical protein [Saccharococcus caldoxylosilyticus]|uniref:hypothetical protein n=1 Tax=Saccharococcus caldoxylosilyticus TaxID=81408 RepID=UPI001FCB3DC5|nr:hypothetical protein [Parageobacillus caldoxylosilyticus]BDG45432.1 hypothetical protein PcaKH35_37770 [Parageobacillus caldoxylosilyticus]